MQTPEPVDSPFGKYSQAPPASPTNASSYVGSTFNPGGYAQSAYNTPTAVQAQEPSYYNGKSTQGGYAASASNFATNSSSYSGPTSGGGYAQSANNSSPVTNESSYIGTGKLNAGGYAASASNAPDTAEAQQPVNNQSSGYFTPGVNPGGYAQSLVKESPSSTGKKNEILANPELESERRAKADWRVRLTLAKGANYLYRQATNKDILYPLKETDGVIFPYVPTISTSYQANYDNIELTHNNFKIYQYRNSSVGEVQIQADFTAQDTREANYLLAVIHFFKSVTKMFYGRDQDPKKGTPPPLCYLNGFGAFQFDNHPLVISNFSYSLPNDVDYIRAGTVDTGQRLQSYSNLDVPKNFSIPSGGSVVSRIFRLATAGLPQGAKPNNVVIPWEKNKPVDPTYVPTKISLSITCLPIVTRYDISQNFSVTEYAKGMKGYRGSQRAGGGIW